MRGRWMTPLLCALILLASQALANPAAISGRIRCGISDFGWPLSPETEPLGPVSGILEIIADGHGNYTSGQMTEHLGDDTQISGTKVCTFDLIRGTYEQKADGSTANTMTWRLRAGSNPHCGAVVTGAKNLGFIEGARDFREFQRTSTSYLLDDGRMVFVSSNPIGVAIGACRQMAN